MDQDPRQEGQRRRQAGFGASLRAVFWSFFGVRKRKDYEQDAANLNPVYLIVAALVGVMLFIGILMLAVHIAVAHA